MVARLRQHQYKWRRSFAESFGERRRAKQQPNAGFAKLSK
jgi:hypothetical protein